MKIDWSKERCFVCGGEFKSSTIQVTHERTGQTRTRKVMACARCGDTAFSPEQRLARSLKEAARAMRPLPSCGSSDCPGCVNCGRGMSNR